MNAKANYELKHEKLMHRAATLVGGFAGMYTVLTRFNLGSSQTVCILDMMKALLGRDTREFLLRLLGVTLYGCSVFAASYLTKRGRVDTRLISAGLCTAGFIAMGFTPEDTEAVVALYVPFIMLSFLWVVFGSMGGYASAPIFSTNNYRQTIGSVAEYFADHDKAHLDKAKYFAGTLAVFHIGAAAAYFLCGAFGTRAAFFGLIPTMLLFAAVKVPKAVKAFHTKPIHTKIMKRA